MQAWLNNDYHNMSVLQTGSEGKTDVSSRESHMDPYNALPHSQPCQKQGQAVIKTGLTSWGQ